MDEQHWTYFQFFKSAEVPVFIKCHLESFNGNLVSFLQKLNFEVLEDGEKVYKQSLQKNSNSRLLKLTEASNSVSRQIESALESDRFGLESINNRHSYKVYRYKGVGLMVYALSSNDWEVGCYYEFGSGDEEEFGDRSLITRYLSLALAPLGMVGFWGVSIDEGIVVMKQKEAMAEFIFIDIIKRKVFTFDGIKRIGPKFKILKLDQNLKGRNVAMNRESFLSFLTHHCTYFDYAGTQSRPIRQMISTLSRQLEGMIHPRESFRPRTDLSV